MNTTELTATDSLRIISDEDLGAIAGGKQVYEGGGGGTMAPGGYKQGGVVPPLLGFGMVSLFLWSLTV